jgi:hypothetical protein
MRRNRKWWTCRLMGHEKTAWLSLPDGSIWCYVCARVVK